MSPAELRPSAANYEAKKLLISENEDQIKKPFKRQIVWKNVAVFLVGHLIAVYGLWYTYYHIPLKEIIAVFVFGYMISNTGVQMGAHRYYSHRCFKASRALQVAMVLCQTVVSQNCLWVWVRDHRQHHKYTDTDADPHNAQNGFFFSHVGWLLSRKHPDVFEKGKLVDMSDLDADPVVMFQKRHYVIMWILLALVMPILFARYVMGSSWVSALLLWTVIRVTLILHFTWFVNSWAHLWGAKPFDKNIMPSESYFVSFVTMGEGWHNYHHTFPWDYKASEFGSPFNVVAKMINLYARLGLVWDLKQASDEMVLARAWRTGDGSPIRTKPNAKLILEKD